MFLPHERLYFERVGNPYYVKLPAAMRVQLKLQSACRHAGISFWDSDVPGWPRLRLPNNSIPIDGGLAQFNIQRTLSAMLRPGPCVVPLELIAARLRIGSKRYEE